jgi:phage terminase small subunit
MVSGGAVKGRKPTPSSLKTLLGNPSRRPFNENEPKPEGGARCPKTLSPEARRHWRRLEKVLVPLGLLSAGDTDLFGMLCVALARLDRARAEIAKASEVVAIKGRPALHPWLRVEAEASTTVIRPKTLLDCVYQSRPFWSVPGFTFGVSSSC